MIFVQVKFENHCYKQWEIVGQFWIRMQQDKSGVFICQVGVEDALEEGEKVDTSTEDLR